MPQFLVKPANAIYVGGPYFPLEVEIGANATAAKMLPGRVVIHDTTDGHVKEAGAKAANVLGVLDRKPDEKVSTAYAVGDQAHILSTPGTRVLLTLVSGSGAVAPGDALVSAADGKCAKQAVGAMGSQGMVVAKALGTEDPAAADKTVIAELVLAPEAAAAA